MRNLNIIIFTFFILSSCEVVEGPYQNEINSNGSSETVLQKILIEDFTGHTCRNCPEAAIELKSIKELYPNQVIGIALHVGNAFAIPYPPNSSNKYLTDFRTKWGEEIDNYFGVSSVGLPKGMINRKDEEPKSKDDWGNVAYEMINNSPLFDIDISASPFVFGNCDIEVLVKALENLNGEYNIVIAITEDSIVDWQKNDSYDDSVYVHNNVLRAIINNTWGENLKSSNNYTTNEEINLSYSISISSLEQFNINHSTNELFMGNGNTGAWDTNKLNIVAYIYNVDNKEIIQVEELHL